MSHNNYTKGFLAIALTLPAVSQAALLQITIEAPSNLGLAPALLSFHDGNNDFFDVGSAASGGLEELAEVGSTGTLQNSLTTGNNLTVANGGPFFPGNSVTTTFQIDDTNTNFSFAAMLLPSNDWFIGNDQAYDISGLINGPLGSSSTFEFSTVYDAGTELEDFANSPGNPIIGIDTAAMPGAGDVTMNPISAVTGADPFGSFANTSPGSFDSTIYDFNTNNSILGRVTITTIPEPSTILLGVLGGLGMIARRKRS